MPDHTVLVTNAGRYEVGREEIGIKFDVSDEVGLMGRLTISKGGVRWTARQNQNAKLMTWEDFARRMADK